MPFSGWTDSAKFWVSGTIKDKKNQPQEISLIGQVQNLGENFELEDSKIKVEITGRDIIPASYKQYYYHHLPLPSSGIGNIGIYRVRVVVVHRVEKRSLLTQGEAWSSFGCFSSRINHGFSPSYQKE